MMILTYIFGGAAENAPSPAPVAAKAERPGLATRAVEILKACGREWDVAVPLLTGPRVARFIYEPRHAAMALLREEGMTLMEIAAIFRRDHASIIHALKRHRARMRSSIYARRFNRVRMGGG